MSADSQCPSKTQNRSSTEPNTVSPQEVIETTILDNVKSVAGFIQDVVPNSATLDNRDQIQWIRFEHQNNDEYEFDADADRISLRPLLLLVGYPTGVQIWSIPYSGEAVEIYSQRHKNIKAAKILPTPFKVGGSDVDAFEKERPMIAQYDDIITSETQSFNLNIYSMKTNNKVRNIPFGRPIVDVFANRTSLVVTFNDRIAVFDAFTLGDKIVVTTCYPSPGLNPCPIALGSRWLAYAENKLMPQRRSNGGYEGEGVQSVTATVLHAAKTIGKGLLDFTGSVTNSLTGTTPAKPLSNLSSSPGSSDPQKGIITVIDLENPDTVTKQRTVDIEGVVCHFQAHKDAISAMSFDPSGMLLLTADRRGNDFHVFRIHPHPQGPSQAAVHHLYILHRGDTSAKVQDVCFSPDTRWVTVSTHRGTTHVFPVTPYGGPVVSRTHCWDNVVNKMSRFHRSAGLTAEGRSNSPTVLPNEVPVNQHFPFHNPRLPPFPTPTVINPYNQIRQPYIAQNSGSAQQRTSSGRQRSTSTSEDSTQQQVLRVAACFAKPRAWIANGSSKFEANQGKQLARAIEALFVMSVHGTLIEYDLEPKTNVPKSQAYDDSPFQLVVRPKAQWILQRQPNTRDVLTLSGEGLNNVHLEVAPLRPDGNDEQWVPQVEIHTHVGPHRRLWMGPQFSFKTYTTSVGPLSNFNILESKPIDLGKGRSNPVNVPGTDAVASIESGSLSSTEPSPKYNDSMDRVFMEFGSNEMQLQFALEEAMKEHKEEDGKEDFSLKLNQIEEGGPVSFSDEGLICLKSPEIEVLDDPNEPRQRETREVDEKKQKDRRLKHEKYQGLEQKDIISSSEENATEEKILPKKPRKPKTKLGVRISNVNKENADDVTVDFNISLPKRSWSNVAASKPQTKDRSPDLTAAPKANFDEFDVIGGGNRETDAFVGKFTENLIKVDKSSDEEKIGTSSSQTETTESDDSPIDAVAMDTEEDNCAPDVKMTSTVAKASKKKSKKKKR